MEKTVCELFAGVGGFRCGLNGIHSSKRNKKETWNTVWFNQWEPEKKNQWAYNCYKAHFGSVLDLSGFDSTNTDISKVEKKNIPDHNLLVGGFPCQDYSVARGLKNEKGIEGKKGVLWWSILEIIKAKNPSFILLENVDRLLKSPSKQRGRDFGIILSCLYLENYIVEWRVINAAEYGNVQRRRRVFIFAYKKNTKFAKKIIAESKNNEYSNILSLSSFFASSFPVHRVEEKNIKSGILSDDLLTMTNEFSFNFENSGILLDNQFHTTRISVINEKAKTIGEILEDEIPSDKYYIPESKLYYTEKTIRHSDETKNPLTKDQRQTWQYLKGAKKKIRIAKNGHEYIFSEGAIPMIDKWDAPARTMLTSESTFNRSSHIVLDKKTKKIRLITPLEAERIQGFPDDWTNTGMPERMRYFCMGNALVVPLIERMGKQISKIFESE